MSPDARSAVTSEDIPTTGTITLPPAPRSLEALGRNHTLEAALAELVDNSIDAGARHVLIRFVERDGNLVQLVVVDDGAGMSAKDIDIAMTVGGERAYADDEIGRFGFGLKAASFSQAETLTVLSRREGEPAVGRRWRLVRAKEDFSCEIVDTAYATRALDRDWELPPGASGTIVRWDEVKGFPKLVLADETNRFLQDAFARIRTHLGLVYHRALGAKTVRMYLDVEDLDEGLGQRIEVGPLDPFDYPRSGDPAWPRDLSLASTPPVAMRCHLWPGRSTLEQYRLDGDHLSRQGLYVYLNDRLIQRGGWNGLVHADKQLSLARVAIDITGDVPEVLSVKPEKNGIEVGPRFAAYVREARSDDGTSFADYIETARTTLKEANRRKRQRAARIPPGSGFDPRLRRAIEQEVPMKDDDPIAIRWAPLGADRFFDLDREERVIWLNKRFRPALLGGQAGSLNDAPVLKALLYLLLEEIFAGQNIGPRDKDNIELWQSLLLTAAEAQAR